jgi:hypothetical protein
MKGKGGGTIWVETRCWFDAASSTVVLDVQATPDADEPGVCSCSVTVDLPAADFADGDISMDTSVKFPSATSAPRDDCNPFATTSASNTFDTLERFVVSTSDHKATVAVAVDAAHSTSTRVRMYDVRKWGPSFSIRVGDVDSAALDWPAHTSRRWRLYITSRRSSLRLLHLVAAALRPEQLQAMKHDGFVMLRNMIPSSMIAVALRTINHALGNAKAGVTPEQACAAIGTDATLTALFNSTQVRSVVEHFLGVENVPEWAGNHVQVALRYPMHPTAQRFAAAHAGYHIDGIPTDNNGLEPGKLHPFTMLIGVYLNDAMLEDAGNLFVYPGSHIEHAKYFAQHGPECLLHTKPFKMPPIALPRGPTQITVNAGDVILAHYLLAHGIACNVSPNIRYALYFRVSSKRMSTHSTPYHSMKDPWIDWPSMQ